MNKIPPIVNGEWLLDLSVMKENIPDKMWDSLFNYSYNGIVVESLEAGEFPIPWDASIEARRDRLVISGGAGPNGWGKVTVEIPLKDAFSGTVVKFSVEPRMEYTTELLALLEEMGIEVME